MLLNLESTNQKNVGPMTINEYLINSKFSGALIEIDGEHGSMKSTNEDRIYFIISGNGKFMLDGEIFEIKENDLIFVPKLIKKICSKNIVLT